MIRAAGFLLGAVLMSAVFLLVLGDGVATSPLQLPVSSAAAITPTPTDPELAEDDSEDIASLDNEDLPDTIEVSRYRVWSPFHSKWAAEGFAQRLSQATDVPVEVINEAPGNYQVVFSYRDDGERQALVEHIETITGLELE